MPSTRERFRALIKQHPHLNQTELAERLGVTRQRVSRIAAAEQVALDTGKRGPRGRAPAAQALGETAPTYAVPGAIPFPPVSQPAVAVLLTAADLVRRGYEVYYPLTGTGTFDLITVDSKNTIEPIAVRTARRVAGEVRYDTPELERKMRRAMILRDEPIQYDPPMREPK